MSAGDAASLNACVIASANCAAFTVFAVHVETAQLSPWSGLGQIVTGGQNFAPVTVEVTDAVGHPMAGAAVTFYETLHAWTPACPPREHARRLRFSPRPSFLSSPEPTA